MSAIKTPTFTKPFWVMCLGSVVFCASFQMVIPNMPDYIASLGGEKYKDYHIALFATMALISRPFSGILADRIGRIPILMFGAGICFAAGIGYYFAFSFWMVLMIRFLHGMSTGFTPTGATAYVSDLTPANKRGIAMGIHGVSNNLGMAIGPILGGAIFNHFGFDYIYIVSSVLGIIALLIFRSLPETAESTHKFKMGSLRVVVNDFFEPLVYGPFIVVLAISFGFGAFLTIAPEHSKMLNIKNLGTTFSIMTLSSIITRLYAGYLSDIYGRVWVLRISLSTLAIVSFFIAGAANQWTLYLLVAIWGLCQGASSPTIFAWTTDKATPEQKGRAYATVFIGLELGIITGGYFTGLLMKNYNQLSPVYAMVGAVIGLAALFLWFTKIDFNAKPTTGN